MEALQLINKMENSNEYLQEHYSEIQEEHKDEYVAIEDGNFVGSDKDYDNLLKKLKRQKKNLVSILIEFVPKKGVKVIL